MKEPQVVDIGEKFGKVEARVSLRWLIQPEAVAKIPNPEREDRIRANILVFDFELPMTEEMVQISSLTS